jgi:hypothetical protein
MQPVLFPMKIMLWQRHRLDWEVGRPFKYLLTHSARFHPNPRIFTALETNRCQRTSLTWLDCQSVIVRQTYSCETITVAIMTASQREMFSRNEDAIISSRPYSVIVPESRRIDFFFFFLFFFLFFFFFFFFLFSFDYLGASPSLIQ